MKKSADVSLTEEEFERLFDVCETVEDKMMILALGRIGLRKSEYLALRPSWFDWQGGRVSIPLKDDGWKVKKPMSARTIPVKKMEPALWELLRAYFRLYDKITMHPSTVWRRVKNLARKAGLDENLHPHGLRATAATYWGYRMDNEYDFCDLFGWEDSKTAKHYVKRSGKNLDAAIDRAKERG
jgi:integrase